MNNLEDKKSYAMEPSSVQDFMKLEFDCLRQDTPSSRYLIDLKNLKQKTAVKNQSGDISESTDVTIDIKEECIPTGRQMFPDQSESVVKIKNAESEQMYNMNYDECRIKKEELFIKEEYLESNKSSRDKEMFSGQTELVAKIEKTEAHNESEQMFNMDYDKCRIKNEELLIKEDDLESNTNRGVGSRSRFLQWDNSLSDDEKTERGDLRNAPKGILREFIEIYRAHPALWQIRNKELYNNRNLKTKGYIELIKVWKKYDPEANQRSVKLKIQSLRGSFRKELRKVQKSERSGRGVENIYKSHLWYFNMLTFLVEDELPTDSIDNVWSPNETNTLPEPEVILNELVTIEDASNLRPKSSSSSNNENHNKRHTDGDESTSKRTKQISEESEQKIFLAKCTHALESKPDETDALGLYISTKLAKVTNPEQRMYAESLLTKVLNKAIMGKLTEHTDIIEHP